MANTTPTRVSIPRAIYLCFLAIVRPTRFNGLEDVDNRVLEASKASPPERNVFKVRRALAQSGRLVAISAVMGWVVGEGLRRIVGEPQATTVAVLQGAGALILLWGTLAVRGWEIQSFGGVTLSERVNRWIYRGMCCVGSFLIVVSLEWVRP